MMEWHAFARGGKSPSFSLAFDWKGICMPFAGNSYLSFSVQPKLGNGRGLLQRSYLMYVDTGLDKKVSPKVHRFEHESSLNGRLAAYR